MSPILLKATKKQTSPRKTHCAPLGALFFRAQFGRDERSRSNTPNHIPLRNTGHKPPTQPSTAKSHPTSRCALEGKKKRQGEFLSSFHSSWLLWQRIVRRSCSQFLPYKQLQRISTTVVAASELSETRQATAPHHNEAGAFVWFPLGPGSSHRHIHSILLRSNEYDDQKSQQRRALGVDGKGRSPPDY